jgi:hypothetical protein
LLVDGQATVVGGGVEPPTPLAVGVVVAGHRADGDPSLVVVQLVHPELRRPGHPLRGLAPYGHLGQGSRHDQNLTPIPDRAVPGA